jgi:hypothetical protein
VDFQKLLPGAINLPGVLTIILGTKVRGYGVKVQFSTPFWQGDSKKQGFGQDAWIAKLDFVMSSVE